MSQLEILAPAGNMEMLTAAARSGADAVYLGLGNFNARRTANGFFGEQLAEAVRFCHARGVRVHGAVNTTVYAPELPALAQTITDAAQAGSGGGPPGTADHSRGGIARQHANVGAYSAGGFAAGRYGL